MSLPQLPDTLNPCRLRPITNNNQNAHVEFEMEAGAVNTDAADSFRVFRVIRGYVPATAASLAVADSSKILAGDCLSMGAHRRTNRSSERG